MVYFIKSSCNKFVKIGYSKDPTTRLKELQTANPYKLSIVFTCEGGYQTEIGFHELFSQYRTRGEWFSITGKLKVAMKVLNTGFSSAKELELEICRYQVLAKIKRKGRL